MDWLSSNEIAPGVHRFSEPLEDLDPQIGLEGVHSYLVLGDDRAVLIDTGCGIGDLAGAVKKITDLPLSVLNTHAHWDHAGGNYQFQERWIHPLEAEKVHRAQEIDFPPGSLRNSARNASLPEQIGPEIIVYRPVPATGALLDGQKIDLGGRTLRVIHSPGHSPGHCCFDLSSDQESEKILFTGDTAFQGPVFACFPGADPAALLATAWKLAFLEGVRLICPGHQHPIRDPRWLEDFAQGVTAAVGGHLPGRDRGPSVIGREYRLRNYSVWLPSG